MVLHQRRATTGWAMDSPERLARPTHGLLLWQLGQAAGARFRRALQPLGLQTQPFIALKALALRGPSSQADLSAAVGADASNLASIVTQLVDAGAVDRRRDEANRRRYVVSVTPAGLDLLERAQDAIEAAEDDLLAGLGPAERDELRRLLLRVADGGAER
jgi:DNA-binding MarR family transcriptional regulator